MSSQPTIPARDRRGLLLHRRAAVAGIGALLALAVASAPTVLAADADVDIAGFAFDPPTVTVSVGDTVTWTNSDTAAHTATGTGGAFDTGSIAVGETASVTFDTAGTFDYLCSIHPTMTASVVVEAAAEASTPPTDGETDAGPTSAPRGVLLIMAVAALGAVATIRRLAPERRRAG